MSLPLPNRHPELVSGPISRLVRSKRWQTQPHRKVCPMRVALVDQVDLPRAVPVLELLLAQDCRFHPAKQFEMDEPVNFVARGMSRQRVASVLPKPADQVGSHANVQRSIKPTGQNVDARLFVLSGHASNNTVKWALKQVQGDEVGVALDPIRCTTQTNHAELVSAPIVRKTRKSAE